MADVLTGVPIGGPGSPGELGAMLPAVFKGGQSILWSPAGRGDVTTFYQALAIVQASKAPTRIYVDQHAGDPPLTVPAGVYEMHGSAFCCYAKGDPSLNLITCERKTKFRNLFLDGPLIVQGNNLRLFVSDDGPLLENDSTNPGSSPEIYFANNGGIFQNNGTGGLVDVGLGGFVFLGALSGGGFQNGAFAGSFVKLHAGQACGLASLGPPPSFDTHTVTSDIGAGIVGLLHDGNIPVPIDAALFPLFTGALKNQPFGQLGGSGASAYRPDGMLGAIPIGCMYVDFTSMLPIWWDPSGAGQWRDATWAVVP